MRTYRFYLFSWIVFLFCLVTLSPPFVIAKESLADIVKRISPSVVVILAYDKEGKAINEGSGFFVNEKGDVIANRHVLEGASRAEVKTAAGKIYPVKEVLAEDSDWDLIYISVEIPVKELRPLSISSSLPEVGEAVVVIGNPLGLEQTVSDGIVSAVREITALEKIIQITAPISPDSSGSPVVNMKGDVIGVATLQMGKGQNLNFAVPGEKIARLVPSRRESVVEWEDRRKKEWVGSAKELYSKALPFILAEEYEEALPYFERVVEKKPGYAEAHYFIGVCKFKLGQYQEAVEAFYRAIHIKADFAEAFAGRGESYSMMGQYDKAIPDFKKALEINPRYASAYSARGGAYYRKGQYDEAISDFNKAVEIDPRNADAHNHRGMAYGMKGHHDEAIADFNKAIETDPKYATAYYNRGFAYLNNLQHDQAIADFNMAIELNPRDANAYYNRGLAYLLKGEYEKAWDDVHKTQNLGAKINPEFLEALRKVSGRQE